MIENFPHNFQGTCTPVKVIKSKIGNIFFYENIVVVEINEGVSLSYKNGFSLLLKGMQHFGKRSFVYISNRVNSYAVNPNDYKYLNKIPTLKGIVIVKTNPDGLQNEQFEEKFVKKPFKVVNTMEEGFEIANRILE